LHSDFRGLISADYEEALANCGEGDKNQNDITILETSILNGRGRRKPSTSVKEIFPFPNQNNFSAGS
jgi:hypothetical protein